MITTDEVSEKLYAWLLNQPKEKLLDGLLEAIDVMQQYNGRSMTYCIATAFNFKEIEEGRWQYPIKKGEAA